MNFTKVNKMKDHILTYTKEQVLQHAKDFFVEVSGFDVQKERHQRMMNDALELLEKEKPEAELKVICTKLGKESFAEGKVIAGDVQIGCNGFSRIDAEHVLDVFICVITAGEWHLPEAKKARHQVYMDTWGTAFVDGTKVLFEQYLMERMQDGEYLSDPFGPGYYGMPSTDTHKFAEILDMNALGVDVRDSGIMVPLKSMAAIYLVTDNENVLPPMACSECFGRVDGCRYCKNHKAL